MRGLALALAVATAAPAAAADGLRPVPLEALRGQLESPAAISFEGRAMVIPVDGNTSITFSTLRAQVLELDVQATGPMMLTWAMRSPGRPFRPFGPPWRHLTLPTVRTTITLDLRIADGWAPAGQPLLGMTGVGKVIVHGMRVLPPPRDAEEARAALDGALRWAPEHLSHTTINLLDTPWWSLTRGIPLVAVTAALGVAAGAAWLGVARLRRRRARPAAAFAAGALAALAAWNLHFLLVRFVPMLHLAPVAGVEERIREHYDIAPEVGALAALARATLRPDERVGAMGPPGGWFAPQTVCFNLAPRPCVIVKPGEGVHSGISGVGRLRDDELDAVVVHRVPVPPGFVPVAALGPSAVVARRVR